MTSAKMPDGWKGGNRKILKLEDGRENHGKAQYCTIIERVLADWQ